MNNWKYLCKLLNLSCACVKYNNQLFSRGIGFEYSSWFYYVMIQCTTPADT